MPGGSVVDWEAAAFRTISAPPNQPHQLPVRAPAVPAPVPQSATEQMGVPKFVDDWVQKVGTVPASKPPSCTASWHPPRVPVATGGCSRTTAAGAAAAAARNARTWIMTAPFRFGKQRILARLHAVQRRRGSSGVSNENPAVGSSATALPARPP